MKTKTTGLIFGFLAISLLTTINNVNAISGACSYHGGVDCSAGADYDGSVICNDGWRESSVGYYETYMCRSSNIPLCVYPVGIGCTTESDYSSRRALWARSGYPDTELSNLQECRNQIDKYNRSKAEYDTCLYKMMSPTPYPTLAPTPPPTPTPYYNPCPDGWINLKSLNLCINPATPTPSPIITASPTPTEPFKDLFKDSKPSATPRPKATPKIVPAQKLKPTMFPSINPKPSATTELAKETPVANNALTKIFKIFRKIKFW